MNDAVEGTPSAENRYGGGGSRVDTDEGERRRPSTRTRRRRLVPIQGSRISLTYSCTKLNTTDMKRVKSAPG